MALSFESLSPHTQQQVLAGLIEEEVDCAPLQDILQRYAICLPGAASSRQAETETPDTCSTFDVFAVDTEGYDLKILQQLFGALGAGKSTLTEAGAGGGEDAKPSVVFMEVGLLSPPDQATAIGLLESQGYMTQRCGYGMELLATLLHAA